MIKLPIDLQFIETKYGNLLLNPLGNYILIPSDDFVEDILKCGKDMLIFGNGYLELK